MRNYAVKRIVDVVKRLVDFSSYLARVFILILSGFDRVALPHDSLVRLRKVVQFPILQLVPLISTWTLNHNNLIRVQCYTISIAGKF